jgi:hypothetical protein
MWVWTRRPLCKFQHIVHKTRLFGPFLNQKVIHTTCCWGNHLLQLSTHSNQCWSGPWCTRPRFCCTNVFVCSTMSQTFKNYIWTQLGLGYTMKQIYNKYKAIWWAWINVKEPMTKDYFLKLQDIVYLDRKHKKGNWCLHWN